MNLKTAGFLIGSLASALAINSAMHLNTYIQLNRARKELMTMEKMTMFYAEKLSEADVFMTEAERDYVRNL